VHEVTRKHAHVGIALDGDADRVIFVDEKGAIVDGDAIMALCGLNMLRERRLSKKTLVSTVMSNMGLEHALSRGGGKLVRTSVGDRYVVEAMRQHGYNFGGEQSGHLIFAEHATTGDGTVAALQVLAIMLRQGKALSELAAVMRRVPQILENLTLPARRPIAEMPELTRRIQQAEKKLGKDGRVLVRWSGTEPKLRLMLEGPEPKVLRTLAADMAEAARKDVRASA
jgi:phosphoglucosamine mutase